jgi:hypothetical protein
MIRRLFCCTVALLACVVVRPSLGQTNPTHVCPQFSWGHGDGVYYWYSEYIAITAGDCQSITWDNYDGGPNEPTGGTCGNEGSCIGFKKDAAAMRASEKMARRGLSDVPDPDYDPELGPTATVVDKKIVDVMITDTKVIKVKLYLLLIDPRVAGKPLPPIFVANGFEVTYDPSHSPYLTIPNKDVTCLAANLYRLRIGQVDYQVMTHNEGPLPRPAKKKEND